MIKVIFCAFNEENNLQQFLTNLNYELRILERDFEIIVCLDGSTDGSFQYLNELQKFHPIRILEVTNQRGLGLAYKRLFLDENYLK